MYKRQGYHTHPYDGTNPISPPSSSDIATYIETASDYMGHIIFDDELIKKYGANAKTTDTQENNLPYQSELVFAKDGVYVYYISVPLLEKIIDKLNDIYETSDKDLVKADQRFETLSRRIEIDYMLYLSKNQPRILSEQNYQQYLAKINSIGVIIKRFPYDNVEVYVNVIQE